MKKLLANIKRRWDAYLDPDGIVLILFPEAICYGVCLSL
jgi:hypothetical protein